MELIGQANDMGLRIDHVVHATGSAGTQAGLIAGLAGIRSGVPLLGIGVRAPRDRHGENVFKLACATAELCGTPGAVRRADIAANCDSAVLETELYARSFGGHGIDVVHPVRQDELMSLINAVKGGETGTDIQTALAEIAGDLAKQADVLLVGCSELSVIAAGITAPFVDSLDVQAEAIVSFATSSA